MRRRSESNTSDSDLLRRFVDGEAGAFGELFDRHVGSVQNRARGIARGADDADDLVQRTFLGAIESAGRFDPDRSFSAWLYGILDKQARLERRRTGRSLARWKTVADAVDSTSAPSALDTCAQAELRAGLDAAVRQLPERYRVVVRLAFDENQTPTEIAARLDREPAAVRQQLLRGLRMLRRSVPAGLAGGAAILLSPARITAMRSALLEAAERTASAPATRSTPVHAIRPARAPVAITAAGFIALAAALAFVSRTPDTAMPRASTMTASAGPAEPSARIAPPADANRRTVPSGDGEAETSAEPPIVVRYDDQTAASDFELTLRRRRGYPTQFAELLEPGVTLRTDAGGRLDLAAIPDGNYEVVVPGDMPRLLITKANGAIRGRRSFEIGPRRNVRGRVVAPSGRAVANAEVLVGAMPPGTVGSRVATTDAEGCFDAIVACHPAFLWATAPGHQASPILDVSQSPRETWCTLQLGAAGTALRGRVYDVAGGAVQGALVGWFPRGSSRPPVFAPTSEDGTFTLPDLPDARGALVAYALGRATAAQILEPRTTTPLQICMRPGATLTGVVTDAGGRPVPGAKVLCGPAPLGPEISDGGLRVRHAVSDDAGRYRIEGLAQAPAFLLAHSAALGLRARDQVDLRTCSVHDITVYEASKIRGRVFDAGGRPLESWPVAIEVVGRGDPRFGNRIRATDETDRDGRFEIPVRDPNATYRVGLFAPDGRWLDRVPPLALRRGHPGADVEFRVETDAVRNVTVHGRVALATAQIGGLVATLERVDWTEPMPLRIAADGTIDAAHPVPPGPYVLEARHPRFGRISTGPFEIPARAEPYTLPTVQFDPPATVALRISDHEGAPLAAAWVVVTDHRQRILRRRGCDATGAVEVAGLAPGQYTLTVAAPGFEVSRFAVDLAATATATHPVTLRPAVACDLEFAVSELGRLARRPSVVSVRVAGADGGTIFSDARRVGADARTRFAIGLAEGTYTVEATTSCGRSKVKRLQVGQTAQTLSMALR